MDRDIKVFKQRLGVAQKNRANFESHWQQIGRVLMPKGARFLQRAPLEDGSLVYNSVYDSTGIRANQLLSSGFFSLLTSPSTPWFNLLTSDTKLNQREGVKYWLALVSKVATFEIQRPQTGWTTSLHENYLEWGAYGNAIMFITWRQDMSSLLYMSMPLHECYAIENDEGEVTELIRVYYRTPLQLVERFGYEKVGECIQKLYDNPERQQDKIQCAHFIWHNRDGRSAALFSEDMPYRSTYMSLEHDYIISESGFNEKPFMFARFEKMPGETYGQGPGSVALEDLNTLQEVTRTKLKISQLRAEPPLMVSDDGFINAPRIAPGEINYFRSNTNPEDRIQPLFTGGDPAFAEQEIVNLQNRIRDTFYVDQLQLNQGPQMTATEVLQRTEEKLRLMAPIMGRASTELLSPIITRSLGLLARAGKLPPPPAEVMDALASGVTLQIVYTSPIFKAQEQVGANNLSRTLQVLTPLMADPQYMDAFHPQRTVRDVSDMFSVNPAILRTEEELQELAEQRAEAAQAEQQASQLKDLGIGLNNLASAGQKAGNSALGGMGGM